MTRLVAPCQACGSQRNVGWRDVNPPNPQKFWCEDCADEWTALTRERGVPQEISLAPSFVSRLRSALHRVASSWF